MNAAARVINQDTLFNGQLTYMRVSKSLYMIIGLLLAVLISGFAVVYSTNAYRSTFNLMQQETLQTHHLQVQWGQLLLEQASLATPARVEDLATNQLKMVLPNTQNTYLLKSQ
jgi:cell division protein FtsL